MAKFQNRVHVYSVEAGFPVFFDIDGRGTDIFPTGMLHYLFISVIIIFLTAHLAQDAPFFLL